MRKREARYRGEGVMTMGKRSVKFFFGCFEKKWERQCMDCFDGEG